VLIGVAACADVSTTLVAPLQPSRLVGCLVCDDGEDPGAARLQENAVRLAGGSPPPSPVLPDPYATGPQTPEELAKFGPPTATGISVLADAHFEGTKATGDAGTIATGGRAIVSMTGSLTVWGPTLSPITAALRCRGLSSCWDYARIIGIDCNAHSYRATTSMHGTVWASYKPINGELSHLDTCTPSPAGPPSGGSEQAGDPPGFTCHDEQVEISTTAGSSWSPMPARVCVSNPETGSTPP
jgi:hypothetical protein